MNSLIDDLKDDGCVMLFACRDAQLALCYARRLGVDNYKLVYKPSDLRGCRPGVLVVDAGVNGDILDEAWALGIRIVGVDGVEWEHQN